MNNMNKLRMLFSLITLLAIGGAVCDAQMECFPIGPDGQKMCQEVDPKLPPSGNPGSGPTSGPGGGTGISPVPPAHPPAPVIACVLNPFGPNCPSQGVGSGNDLCSQFPNLAICRQG